MTTELTTRHLIPSDNIISAPPEPSGFEMKPRTLDEAMKFCELMANSDLVPSGYKGKPGNIMVAIQMGSEIGLTPMRALRCIAVINGRASMWGDEVLAMVQASPVCEYVDESESTDKVGVCKTKRKGCKEQVSIFTLEDATRAGLLGKQGPWQQHTGRMLKLRARGFALRDTFADVLAGLVTVEEALDLPAEQPEEAQTGDPPKTLKEKLKEKVDSTHEGAAPVPVTSGVSESGESCPGEENAPDAPSTILTYADALDRLGLAQTVKEANEYGIRARELARNPAEKKHAMDAQKQAMGRIGQK